MSKIFALFDWKNAAGWSESYHSLYSLSYKGYSVLSSRCLHRDYRPIYPIAVLSMPDDLSCWYDL